MSRGAAAGGPAAAPAGVPSPCVNVCRMDTAGGLCEGCQRTIDEIAAWGTLDDEAKRAVWLRIDARRRVSRRADDHTVGQP